MYLEELSVLPDLVELMLPTFSDKLALRFGFDLRVSYYDDDDEINLSRYLDMIIHRPNNYTKIYTRQGEDYKKLPDIWFKDSDHDSCWRSDGFDGTGRVIRELESEILEEKQDRSKLSRHVFFCIFNKPAYITLEDKQTVDKDKTFPRHYKLSIGPEVPLREIHQYLRK